MLRGKKVPFAMLKSSKRDKHQVGGTSTCDFKLTFHRLDVSLSPLDSEIFLLDNDAVKEIFGNLDIFPHVDLSSL